jgi:hypothetical protein
MNFLRAVGPPLMQQINSASHHRPQQDDETINGITRSSSSSSTNRRKVQVVSHETNFIEACIEELTPTSKEDAKVSQVHYASFLILYCRDDANELIRGSECSNALFFYQDLPQSIQIEFVRYTSCIQSTTEDMTLEECLDAYNKAGAAFYMDDVARVPALCTYTYPLMISTELLRGPTSDAPMVAPTTTSQPTVPATTAPITAPVTIPTLSPMKTVSPTVQQPTIINAIPKESSGISNVGILAITITILFAIMFTYQTLIVQYRKYYREHKKQHQNDAMALQEDESVVASENSHELLPPIPEESEVIMDVIPSPNMQSYRFATEHTIDTTTTTALPESSSVRGKYWLSTPKHANSSGHGSKVTTSRSSSSNSQSPFRYYNNCMKHVSDNGMQFTYPTPLETDNLSDSNPVHTRKRFQSKQGHFPFDTDTTNQPTRSAATTSTSTKLTDITFLESIDETRTTTEISFNISDPTTATAKKNKANVCSIVTTSDLVTTTSSSAQQSQPPRLSTIIAPQAGKENSTSSSNTRQPTRQYHSQRTIGYKENSNTSDAYSRNTTTNNRTQPQKFTAITFGDVIHTELLPRNPSTEDAAAPVAAGTSTQRPLVKSTNTNS